MSSPLSASSKAIRFIVLLVVMLAGLIALKLIGSNRPNQPADSPPAKLGSLDIGLDAGDLDEKNSVRLSMIRKASKEDEPVELAPSVRVPWQAGQTLLEATRLAGEQSSQWRSDWQGEAEMALLTELSGFANEGSEGLNWQFNLNGKYGERGAGQTVLDANDHALWRLAPYE